MTLAMTWLDFIATGAADVYVRAAALAIGPVLGAVIYAVAMLAAPR
jgi:hypothetical protein